MVKYCTNCGNEISEGTDFCVKCGTGIMDNPAATVKVQSTKDHLQGNIQQQPYQYQTYTSSPAIMPRISNKGIIIAVVIAVIIFTIIGALLLSGVFQDEKSKFIGKWTITNPTSGNAQGIITFYDDGTFKVSTGAIGNFKINNGNICLIPQDDDPYSNTSLCYDYELSNDNKKITLKQNGTAIVVLKKGTVDSDQYEYEEEKEENAAITVSSTDDNTIKVMLVMSGDNYDNIEGYSPNDFGIYINGVEVTGITDPWFVGDSWQIDKDYSIVSQTPIGFESGTTHDVTVVILDTVIYNGSITIS